MLSKGVLKARLSKRIIGLFELSKGQTYSAVRDISHLSSVSLGTLAQRYRVEGLNCLYDTPRFGRLIEIDGTALSDKLTILALENASDGYSQWSLCLLAEKVVELAQRFEFHYTPKKGSWLNTVEIEFFAIARAALNQRIPTKEILTQRIAAIVKERQEKQIKIEWKFNMTAARTKMNKH